MMKKNRIWLLLLLAALLILCLACKGSNDDDRQADETPAPEDPIATIETPAPAPTDIQIIEASPDATAEPTADSEIISFVTPEPDLHGEELNAILRRTTMLEGVTVDGVSVGGMTQEEAKSAVLSALQTKKQNMRVTVTLGGDSEVFSAETIATDDDLNDAIEEAFGIVREDTGYEAVIAEVEAIRSNGRNFPVTVRFNEDAMRAAVNAFADAHETAPVNASVAYNESENKIDFTPDVTGKTVDREALLSELLDADPGETISAPVSETQAEVTLTYLQEHYVLRGSFETSFGSSKSGRKFNICKGAGMITGTILHPGDTFSANGTLGVRNKKNGWEIAGAFVQGKHDQQYGGGVCQLSSTLYNAAVEAGMTIVDRRNHTMKVDYVDWGRDATINSVGNIIDFKFQNSSKSDVIIIAKVDNTNYKKAKKLTMEIWGIPLIEDSDGAYDFIKIAKPEKVKTLKPSGDPIYNVDVTKPVGYKEQVSKKQNGYIYQTYIEYYLNGELVKKEKLATSTYRAYSGEYIVGPSAPETPEPTATPDTPTPDTPTPAPATPTPHDPTPAPATPHDPTPEPATPVPVTPEPATPVPVTPEPATPEPATPVPATPEPATPEPATPVPATPEPDPPTPKPTEPPADTPKPTEPSADPDDGNEG